MRKYLILLLLPFLAMGCQESLKPAKDQIAYFWIWNHGGICGCTISQILIDGEGRIVQIPQSSQRVFIYPSGEWRNPGEGSWSTEILQQNLDFATEIEKTLDPGQLEDLISHIPADEGADFVRENNSCADGAEMSFSALIKSDNSDSYKLIFLGSVNDCSGNEWVHKSRNGRMLVQELRELIIN